MGRMLLVTMRCALLKLLSISCSVKVICCSNRSSSSGSVKVRDGIDIGRDMPLRMVLELIVAGYNAVVLHHMSRGDAPGRAKK